jgi:hypothetical protein
MKKTIFILAILAITISSYGQKNVVTVDSINTKASYCEIVGTQTLFSKKLTICVDYGQDTGGFFTPKDTRLKGEDGNPIKFNSMIDVLNLMQKEGWDFVTSYVIGSAQSGYVYHWLLKRKA